MLNRRLVPSEAFKPVADVFEALLDQTVTRVSLEPWSVRLLLGESEIHIEGAWRLAAPNGAVLDQTQNLSERQSFQLWRILDCVVEHFDFGDEPLPRFVMRTADQQSLEVHAKDDPYEDWSLTAGNVLVVCNGATITVFR